MSQETPIGNLGGSMNQDDSRLVDSILNDLNNSNGQEQRPPQQQHQIPADDGSSQQLTPEQHREMLEHRQHEMMQQQMMQQQMMMQQQKEMNESQPESILDKLQSEWKSILIIVVLSVGINSSMVDDLFKMDEHKYFLQENGTLNMQAVIIKGLVIGAIFFLIKSFVPI
tara:strand:- start:88 stop:594 length:507 start_codon:yes stop_codon:yes gene_type:complete